LYPEDVHFEFGEKGFGAQGSQIASNCDFMLAFSFHDGDSPKPKSGTAATWSHCQKQKQKRFLISFLPELVRRPK
jgi:hypothetical protein